jgi:hypothetical protein
MKEMFRFQTLLSLLQQQFTEEAVTPAAPVVVTEPTKKVSAKKSSGITVEEFNDQMDISTRSTRISCSHGRDPGDDSSSRRRY